MSRLTQQLHEFATSAGADLFGIAPIERFADVSPNHHPASIFPETRSVIALGKRITRGCLRGMEEGTQLTGFRIYAMNWVPNRFLAETTVGVASFLEDHQFEAVPLPDLPPETPTMGIAVDDSRPAPNVMIDFAQAGVRCGLGEIGLTGLLMTPQFGPLQRIQLILTDAQLDPTPMYEGKICDQCGACAQACPLGAIHVEKTETRSIAGKQCVIAEIDKDICLRCENGACPNPSHPAGQPERLGAICMRTCVARLHDEQRLTSRFVNPFRRRPAWMIDRSGKPQLMEK